MQIELSNGYVLMKEVVTRKVSRAFSEALYRGVSVATVKGESEVQSMSPLNVEIAAESLVLGLVEKIVVVSEVDGEKKESFLEPSHDWLDELPQNDFKKIEKYVLVLKSKSDGEAKK